MNNGRPSSPGDRPDGARDAARRTTPDDADMATRVDRLWARVDLRLRASGAPDADGPPAIGFDPPPLDPVRLRAAVIAIVRAWREPSARAALRANPRAALASAGAPLPSDVEVTLAEIAPIANTWRTRNGAGSPAPAPDGTTAPVGGRGDRTTFVVPLPPTTAPPLDEQSMRRLLSESPHAWVIWAAFGPFDHAAPPAEALARRPAALLSRWRPSIRVRWPSLALAGALAAVGAILAVAPLASGGDLAGTAAGPWHAGRMLLAIGLIAAAAMIAVWRR